jgi:hypothetical protein
MNHPFLSITIFLLASFAWGILIAGVLLYLHRPRAVAPTLHHRRKNRDAPVPPTVPSWEREEGGIDYKWINLTGEER